MAENTLEAAIVDMRNGFHNWACFKAHQCGEFAVKALLRSIGKPAYGHSIYKFLVLLREEGFSVGEELIRKAKTLDQYYTPTRYPDIWPEGTPYEFYSEDDSQRAISFCREILEWVKNTWKELSKKEKK